MLPFRIVVLLFLIAASESFSLEEMSNDPQIKGITPIAKTKWLELRIIDYTDQDGKDRKWDYVARTTRQAAASADAVVIIPLLKKYGSDETSTL